MMMEEFEVALIGGRGDLDSWIEVNSEQEVRDAIKKYVAKLKQERDEAVALVEVMREALNCAYNTIDLLWVSHHANRGDAALVTIKNALSITGPDALREIQARTLREAADLTPRNAWEAAALKHKGVSGFLQCRADRIIKGE